MTGAEGPRGGINHDDLARDPKSIPLAGAMGEGEPPLTEVQREVVEEIGEAQKELGKEDRLRRASNWNRIGAFFGVGGVLTSAIDALRASRAEMRARDDEREAQFLAEASAPRTVADTERDEELRPLAGGPPTRDEIYEAEMHPWPHHGMAETIEHNRGLRNDPVEPRLHEDPPDTNAEP